MWHLVLKLFVRLLFSALGEEVFTEFFHKLTKGKHRMSTTPVTPTPVPAKETAGQKIDSVLHLFVLMGIEAASIFVKNPAHQQTAQQIINGVSAVLPALDAELNGGAATTTQG